MNLRLVFLTLILLLGIAGCTPTIQGIYGIKKPKTLNDQAIIHYSQKYNIPLSDSYKFNATYLTYLSSLDTIKYKEQIKNHYQPLQVLYYNNSGQLKSFHINCYAGGFPNLNWNINGSFLTFPPGTQATIDSIIPLDLQLQFLLPLAPTKTLAIEEFDFIVIVYWNRFMGRQSKRLIHLVQENFKLSGEYKVKILFVNTDNIYALHAQ